MRIFGPKISDFHRANQFCSIFGTLYTPGLPHTKQNDRCLSHKNRQKCSEATVHWFELRYRLYFIHFTTETITKTYLYSKTNFGPSVQIFFLISLLNLPNPQVGGLNSNIGYACFYFIPKIYQSTIL